MKEINEIRSQIGTLKAKLREAEERLKEAGLRHMGLKIGDRIVIDGKHIAEVTGCTDLYGKFRPTGLKVKKDGEVGLISAGYIDDSWRKL